MPDAEQLRNLLEHTGFDDVQVTRAALPVRFDSAAQLGSTLAASAIAADLEALPARLREQLGKALDRRTAANDALDAEAVAHVAFARR